MSQKQLAYIAHYSGSPEVEGVDAVEFVLTKHPEMAFVRPWIIYFDQALDRALSDALVLLLRCDVIVLLGEQKLTPEATAELALARALKLQINDYRKGENG